MSSTTPSAQAGTRTNTAPLATLGLGNGPRASGGNGESGGAAFSEMLRDKCTSPSPEPAKAATPGPAPARPEAPARTAAQAQARKSDVARQQDQAEAADAASNTEAEDQATTAQGAGAIQGQADSRSRRAAKAALSSDPLLNAGGDAAKALQLAAEPPSVAAADGATLVATTESGEDTPEAESDLVDASVAQAILQMLNSPVLPTPARATAGGDAALPTSADGTAPGIASQAPPTAANSLPALPLPSSPSDTAATPGKDAALATTGLIQLSDSVEGRPEVPAGAARLTRAAEALQGASSPTTSAAPGSFAAHLQALSNPRSAQAEGSSAPAQVALAQPLHSPEFAPAMSARLALLAAEGVQQARLQLNPAEMGPVSVQITLDGQQAQIAFHAVQADTRQVLEQSLPELAAALRDQGLTLSGGGVFEQSQQQAREQAQQGLPSHPLSRLGELPGDAENLSPQMATSRAAVAGNRGMLDLYA